MKQFVLFLAILSLIGCKKPVEETINSDFTNGFFALNEGLFQQNNASLAFYSNERKSMNLSVFSHINKRGLGDTANDMIAFVFNGKHYYAIAVNVSSQVEIIDGLTLESVAQIGLFNNGVGREPRTLQYHNDHIYSINFDGTVSVISMTSLEETATISVGSNPEASLIVNQQLFVVNTGGLNFPNYDSTISVIDLQSHTQTHSFTTAINGSSLLKDDEGDGYMISRGNYSDIPPALMRLDLENGSVLTKFDLNCISMTYANGFIYYYDDEADAIFRFNTSTETAETTVLIDCSDFENVYNITINEAQQLIYVIDANGYVNSSIIRIYNMQGVFQREIISGLNTNTLLFVD